ncbi:hypothetical protein IGI39_004633 [Enterococcus sp. AZ135]
MDVGCVCLKKIERIINDEYDNHIMPFLWMHGEEEVIIREYISKIAESDIQSICIESRPHEDFLAEKWWTDVDIILEECEKFGMTVWILDDKHFPTGYAAGRIKADFPEYQKLFLSYYQLDVVGPKKNVGTLIKWTTQKRPNFMNVGTETAASEQRKIEKGTILSVVAAPMTGYEKIDDSRLIDISEHVKGDMLYWDIPDGNWSIFVCFETTEGGEHATEGYLNPLVAKATDVLIDTVYEAHYEKYGEKFGRGIEGFFSDEPRFGNIKGPDAAIGKKDMPLPWYPEMTEDFAAFLQISRKELLACLPLLYKGESEEAKQLRFAYMTFITERYKNNFTERIGAWCERHGVKYIGHVIEDNNAHSRLGYGAGHFFKSMAGQDMSGIDIVLHQLLPNQNQGYFKSMTANGWDGEFFHYALAKLGTSLAYLDPKKKGRTMCEVFGAYGWAEGTKLMKWMADHLLVRGVNYFVPHAFTMKEFPDSDCPPHFYAHGENPQYFGFGELMRYMNKISDLFSGGEHCSDVAVLYNAEAEWTGNTLPFQKVTKILTENQIEFDFVSCEMVENSSSNSQAFHINSHAFKVLLIPYSEYLPEKTIKKLNLLAGQGVDVLFIDGFLKGASEGTDIAETISQLQKTATTFALEALSLALLTMDIDQLETAHVYKDVRYFHYRQEKQSIYMLFNESMLSNVNFKCNLKTDEQLFSVNPLTNKVERLIKQTEGFEFSLAKGESILLFEDSGLLEEQKKIPETLPTTIYDLTSHQWAIAVDGKGVENSQSVYPAIVQHLPLLGLGDVLEDFSGTISYETELEIKDTFYRADLKIENANEIATVYLNQKKIATRISYPYDFDLTDHLSVGTNHLKIEVVNSLGRYMKDFLSQYLNFEPLGLSGEVNLELTHIKKTN